MSREMPEGCIPFLNISAAAAAMMWEVEYRINEEELVHFSRETAIEKFAELLDNAVAMSDDDCEAMYKKIMAATRAMKGAGGFVNITKRGGVK